MGSAAHRYWPGEEDRRSLARVRPTRQRLAVLDAVERVRVFASAQAIHQVLDGDDQHVGLSTVYRSLQLMAGHGLLDAVRGPHGEMLYRRCAGDSHHHVVCRHCGKAVEMSGNSVGDLVRRRATAVGYRDIEYELQVFGTCSECVRPAR